LITYTHLLKHRCDEVWSKCGGVYRHALDTLKSHFNTPIETLVCLYNDLINDLKSHLHTKHTYFIRQIKNIL